MKTIVISTFPACGVSQLCDNHNGDPYVLLDLRFQRFRNESDGNFPKNYVRCIERNIGKVDFIFVSSHSTVRKLLKKKGIKHFLIFPNIDLKDDWIRKMKSMNYEKRLINKIHDNFDQLIFNMQTENSPLVYTYQLSKRDPCITMDTLDFMYSEKNPFIMEFHNITKDF